MKAVLPFALLFVCTAAVQAQAPARTQPTEPPPAQAAPASDGASSTPAPPQSTRRATASEISAVRLRAPVERDDTDQGFDPPRNFWWTVGAIVLAGIILAILL